MKARLIVTLFSVLIILAGCTSDSVLEPEIDLVVIRGYLYANEPLTNIENGLGVFSAFNSVSVDFQVVRE